MLIVDRIEGHIAIIEDKGDTIEIPRHFLPKSVKEGDVIKIIVDEVATKKRKQDIEKLAEDLFD